uniref:Uncharacterized protein n=1 Tax=Grammatophora oceanica TaxID=210454 RepID=A0A7S1VQ77_9STRA
MMLQRFPMAIPTKESIGTAQGTDVAHTPGRMGESTKALSSTTSVTAAACVSGQMELFMMGNTSRAVAKGMDISLFPINRDTIWDHGLGTNLKVMAFANEKTGDSMLVSGRLGGKTGPVSKYPKGGKYNMTESGVMAIP